MRRAMASWICLGISAAACGNDSQGSDAAIGDPSLAMIRSEILDHSCAFGSCHGATSPAAKLDLSAADLCSELVSRRSCLFPSRTLVVPGDPEASFLMSKLRGTNLDEQPAETCAETNHRMPLGSKPLAQDQIALIDSWIRDGARCGEPVFDAGVDGIVAPGEPAPITALTTVAASVRAGEQTTITITLSHGAPAGGQLVDLDVSDATVLGVPTAIQVDEGIEAVTVTIKAKRPAHPVTITATSANTSQAIQIGVTGLVLSEVYFDSPGVDDGLEWIELRNETGVAIDLGGYSIGAGRTSYGTSKVPLLGTIPPNGCFVVGCTTQDGDSVCTQKFNFSPDLPNGTSDTTHQAVGFALFDVPITGLETRVPIDAVLCGESNPAGLLDASGVVATPLAPM
jgi:hypothetical protein